ncbi:MAG: DNA polymerase III subunit alpha [Muribaculaceae bacterium]|nr:DNA polymerase III subunit alpha [Muribaculaceae bacterium]
MQPFVHLHVHSQYSVLDGQASVKALVDKAIANGMRGIALTDHGNMFGIKELTDYVNKKNKDVDGEIKNLKKTIEELKSADAVDQEALSKAETALKEAESKIFTPIIGCEMYVADNDMTDRSNKKDIGRHLIVLAKNQHGYHNLIKLVSNAWTDGYYYHPRTDKKQLEKYHEDLIVCSACLGGEVPKLITAGHIEEAEKSILWFKKVFGEDYYLELQRHKATVARANQEAYPLQQEVNKVLIEMSKKHNIKLVCTNDVHFVNEEDAEAHDRLICVSTGTFLDDDKRMLYTKQEWMKTQEEMNELFADVPEALSNTQEVLGKVERYSIEHGPILPNFPLPEGFTDNNDYLRHLVLVGAEKRWGKNLTDEQKERIDFELDTIKNMGFPGYFLIVQDFIGAAREIGVSVGPGRGSAAGSAVAYCLGITQIDPIKYDLLFERFLNPDRISLPDIDIDFDDDGRADVLRYVTEKYGAEKVAHIITYGTMAAKSAIKDVARVSRLPLSESDRLTKMIPDKLPEVDGKAPKINLKNCYQYVPELQHELNYGEPIVRETLKYALALEGNVRNTGVHACGVIIGRDDITDWVPVATATDKDGEKVLVTQYEGSVIESTGLIKMDFLGLKTLSIIKEALLNIKERWGKDVDIDHIPLDDPKTYELYCEGRTTGTFQFESTGMQKYLRELHPSTFEDLIAMNALYRPGPMDYIPQFIARKKGIEPIEYDIPVMEKYLKDTYGVTVYQEQVMLLSRLLANFTRGQSDGLRKAMGKKIFAKLAELKPLFINGGKSNGYDEKVLEKIWSDWEKFASYAFNKSHATCYSWVAFQTAYLKANYPPEYMAAVLSRNLNDITKMTKFMDECKAMKVKVKGPDVNESRAKFSVNKAGEIRFGLAGIKGVGLNAVQAILDERDARGEYKSIFDLVERINLSMCNRKVLDNLALSGAFDCFEGVRREDFKADDFNPSFSEALIRYGQMYQMSKATQESSLFGEAETIDTAKPEMPGRPLWPDIERLNYEKDLVGMYLSAHPLDKYYLELTFGCSVRAKDFGTEDKTSEKEYTIGGLVVEAKSLTSRTGSQFGIIKIEDYTGSAEIRLFGQDYINYNKYGIKGNAIIVTYTYKKGKYNDKVYMTISGIQSLEEVQGTAISGITLDVAEKDLEGQAFMTLLDENIVNDGECAKPFSINLMNEKHSLPFTMISGRRLNLTKNLILQLEDLGIKYTVNK